MEKFATEFYQECGLPICPNGDQIRSDELGLFCWIDGARASAELVNGKVRLVDFVELEVKPKKAKPEA